MINLLYWLLAIIMFGVLVMLHELGHFLAARATGVPVAEFAIGFGPKLFSHTGKKNGVLFSLRALPFGGYCRFYADDENGDADNPGAYSRQKIWKRALISVGGPLFNMLVAVLALFLLFSAIGLWASTPVVGGLIDGLPAKEAGFEIGDRIVSVNGREVQTSADASQFITDAGESEIQFVLERDGKEIELSLTPRWSETDRRLMIGIQYKVAPYRFPVGQALRYSLETTGEMSGSIVTFLRNLIFKGEGADELAGPIGTVTVVKEQTQAGGIRSYLQLAALISVNLGIFNMLPIPGLDGSKLIFLLVEKIRGRRIPPEKESVVVLIGFGLLLLLMALVMYQDIVRLFK